MKPARTAFCLAVAVASVLLGAPASRAQLGDILHDVLEKQLETRTVESRDIDCPVKELRTEVTTPLPVGWKAEPSLGALKSASIEKIDGKKRLVCLYAAYDTEIKVMRDYPEDAELCEPHAGGFECR